MSKIDQLIEELLLKKKKITYLLFIKDMLQNDPKSKDFNDVKEEILGKLGASIDLMSKEIEDGIAPAEAVKSENMDILNSLAERLKSKSELLTAPASSPVPNSAAAPMPKKSQMSNQDKLSFAMDNRHLANKQVVGRTDSGVNVSGVVVGLDAPYVYLKTSEGPTVPVLLDMIQIN